MGLQPHHKSGTGVCVWCWRGQETRDSSHADDDHHSQEPAYKDSKHGWSLSPLTTVDQKSKLPAPGPTRRKHTESTTEMTTTAFFASETTTTSSHFTPSNRDFLEVLESLASHCE